MSRPVEERDLNFSHFHCCGDEDLYPFGCPLCGHLMVFCYECDTLYADLNDTSETGQDYPNPHGHEMAFSCPKCGHQFERGFMGNAQYKVSFEQWMQAGFGHLLFNTQS